MLRATAFKFRPAVGAAGSSSSFASSFISSSSSSSSSSSMLRRVNQTNVNGFSSASVFCAAAVSGISSSGSGGFESIRAFSYTSTLLAPKSPYRVLKVPQGADVKTIKAAHRKMSMKYHPDVPGGSHEKFMEIQEAYESIKTGVYTGPRDGSGDKASSASRWQGFRYKTATRDSATFDDVMRDMHSKQSTAGQSSGPEGAAPEGGAPEGAEGAEKPKPKFNPQDIRIQAWFRLLTAWAVCFLVLRVAFFLVFPPKVEKKHRPNPALLNKNLPREKAKAPPPARLPGGQTPQAMH